MVRRCATFASGLALLIALGWAIGHAHTLRVAGAGPDFSAPCEPVSQAFKAPGKFQAVSPSGANFAADRAAAPAEVVRRYRLAMLAGAIPPPAPRTFPPLLHRPPPSNS